MAFTIREKKHAAEREVRQRIKVYRRLVYSGRMTQADADREIELMREIAEDYRNLDQPQYPSGGRGDENEVGEDLLAIDKRGV